MMRPVDSWDPRAWRRYWTLLLVSAPLWPFVWLMAFASLARFRRGYWPSYDQPDPKDLDWTFLEPPFSIFLLGPPAVLLSAGFALGHWFKGRSEWWIPLWTSGSFLLSVLWFWFDPGGFIEWWFD